MTELLPCPFCGGEADEYEGDYGNGIYCMMCGAMVGEPIHLEYRTTKRVSIAEAIAAWNTRAERTCKVAASYSPSDMNEQAEWYFAFTCGCELYWDESEPPNYCPNCGAKVVE